ncbi:hypothetical protein GMA8713_05215 [Grimontia marina]|uniref:Oligopeptide transport permease C-like N-terminal domain-containing protein n=1 Tax=Grimontia marina TaxID=646534 RepID=A0A128FLL6_9GAMM|nr:hypothetical protein GMA8713_05215 [Grimontia marina]
MSQFAAAPSRWERFKQSDFLYYFLRDKVAMTSFVIFLVFLTLSVAAPLIATSTPSALSCIIRGVDD